MIEPTAELQKYWDTKSGCNDAKALYYEGSEFIQELMNRISVATLPELERFIEFIEALPTTETGNKGEGGSACGDD